MTPFEGPGPAVAASDTRSEVAAPPPSGGGAVPRRAEGVQLLGEVPGSGYRVAPALVRRGDGQAIQLTPLLYAVLEQVDGRRDAAEVASAVAPVVGRELSADDVEVLCDKLRTLGVLARADGTEPEVRRSNPLLGLRFKYVVTDPQVTRRITAPFRVLFAPVVVAVIVVAFVAVCAWVLLHKGLASATHQAFDQPALLLAVFALTVVSAGFHEFGHAAAARYGGSTPGAMGTGLYLVWPAFYTDVTDSYRLGRAGRVRTDLGGLYFNAIVAVVMFGVWWVTGLDAILLIIATQVLQMVRQLAPLVRFDGYHVLADLTGVPDLYHRIKPTLLGLLPSRWNHPETTVLKPWARAVVTVWVVVVVPLLLFSLAMMVLSFPRVAGTAWASVGRQWARLETQLGDGDVLAVVVRVLSIVAIALPVLGVVVIVGRVVKQTAAATWRGTAGHPVRRALAGVVALAVVAGLAWSWWPQPGTYRPVQAYERGTLADAFPASLRSGLPTTLEAGRQGAGQAVWPQGAALPTADAPQLAVVMVPRGGGRAGAGAPTMPTWVFPFNRPLPPAEGGNQAMAVNTTDGSQLYDVAFALVWAEGGTVANTNEAYALASCAQCQTVAVAFQVVLVVGQANVVVPENVAAAVNYSCVQCVTAALATQLVVTLSGPLTPESTAELAALWREIAAFGASIEDVPLSELQDRLTDYERRILAIVQRDPAWVAPGAGGPSTPSATTGGSDGPAPPTGGTTAPGSTAPAGPSEPSASSSSSSSSAPDASSTPTGGTGETQAPPTPTGTQAPADAAPTTAAP